MSLISVTYVFSTGATIIASQHNINNSVIYNDYDGNITDVNISPTAAIEYTKLALNNSIKSTDILSTTVFNISNIPTTGIVWQWPIVKVSDVETSGTTGGTATADGAWHDRVLNTKDNDTGSIATLSGNHVTLPAGTYVVSARSAFSRVNGVQIRIQNITGSATLVLGDNSSSPAASSNAINAPLDGIFTIASSSAVAVQYQCIASNGTSDLGLSNGFGTSEIYTTAMFTKIG